MTLKDRDVAERGITYATAGLPLKDTMELFACIIAKKMKGLTPRQRSNTLALMRRLIQQHTGDTDAEIRRP